MGNAVGWEECSGRVNVCAERMVVVFEASNETGRRDDAGVGLLRWRQGAYMLRLRLISGVVQAVSVARLPLDKSTRRF